MLVGVLGGNIFKPGDWHKSFVVGRGLDLSSGTSVTLQAVTAEEEPAAPAQAAMTKAIQIITNRVEATGLTGSTVVQQGKNQIVVSVPGAGAQKVATLVGETALLRLRQVLLVAPNYTTAAATPTPTPRGPATRGRAGTSASPSRRPRARPPAPARRSAPASSAHGQAVARGIVDAYVVGLPSIQYRRRLRARSTSGKPVLSTTARRVRRRRPR